MCGITGFIASNCQSFDLKNMTDALQHRGPNAGAYYWNEQKEIGLGHRRLSIIDLSDSANQPFYSQCGRYIMVYNGEIYNYQTIRKDLQKEKKITFKTNGDTEVIVEAFAHWGIDCIKRWNGMFALAIWDNKLDQLWLIRDRLGIKPLYYYWDKQTFAFASELKAIKAGVALKINKSAVAEFLHLGYLSGKTTFYQNVYKLSAGHYGVFSNSTFKELPYWSTESFLDKSAINFDSFEVAKEELHQLLKNSVQNRLISDVPLGTFLSGGIDSSLVTALAQSIGGKPIKTFSIGFKDQQFNEAIYAEKVAKHLGTEHHPFMLTTQDALDRVDKILDIYDEPFADSSAIPTLLVAEMAKKHVTVALSGDGGDELFMGYGMYTWAKRLHQPGVPTFRKLIAKGLALSGNTRFQRAAMVFDYPEQKNIKSHIFSQEQYLFNRAEISHLLVHKESATFSLNELSDTEYAFLLPEERQALFDIKNYLCEDLLVKVDRASMHHSLEVRVPLLDHKVVEFALGLPLKWKINGNTQKYILKEILYQYVPKKYFDRPKWGFSIPLVRWLKKELRYLIEDYLSKEAIEQVGLVKYEEVKKLKAQYLAGKDYLYNRIWALILLHRWFLEKT